MTDKQFYIAMGMVLVFTTLIGALIGMLIVGWL